MSNGSSGWWCASGIAGRRCRGSVGATASCCARNLANTTVFSSKTTWHYVDAIGSRRLVLRSWWFLYLVIHRSIAPKDLRSADLWALPFGRRCLTNRTWTVSQRHGLPTPRISEIGRHRLPCSFGHDFIFRFDTFTWICGPCPSRRAAPSSVLGTDGFANAARPRLCLCGRLPQPFKFSCEMIERFSLCGYRHRR